MFEREPHEHDGLLDECELAVLQDLRATCTEDGKKTTTGDIIASAATELLDLYVKFREARRLAPKGELKTR